MKYWHKLTGEIFVMFSLCRLPFIFRKSCFIFNIFVAVQKFIVGKTLRIQTLI